MATPWVTYSLPFSAPLDTLHFESVNGTTPQVPAFYRGRFTISDVPTQTFILTPMWGAGVVFVNGFNVGRFTSLGPQCSLYVPVSSLKQGLNEIIVFESDSLSPSSPIRQIVSTDEQLWRDRQGICV